tara:strand:- start:466 stop:885 length:420 start_codon:yes stop_codon:yes gene_type:complete
MSYKLSNRESLLIKILILTALSLSIFYGTSLVKNEIIESKNSLLLEINEFNEKKQLLAQIKALEVNKNYVLSTKDFLEYLNKNNILFEQSENIFIISGLSSLDSLQIMTDLEDQNADINSFEFEVEDSSNIVLRIKFNE